MTWVVVGILAVVVLFEIFALKSAYRKLNSLNEYVQFLLFQPEIYKDHREKFLSLVSQNSKADFSNQAMASYQAIENMALGLKDKILLSNMKNRSEGHP